MPSSSDAPPPRARALASWIDGWRRALGAPAITLGVLLTTLAAAVPLAMAMGDRIEADLGASAEATRAAEGWNAEWAAEDLAPHRHLAGPVRCDRRVPADDVEQLVHRELAVVLLAEQREVRRLRREEPCRDPVAVRVRTVAGRAVLHVPLLADLKRELLTALLRAGALVAR